MASRAYPMDSESGDTVYHQDHISQMYDDNGLPPVIVMKSSSLPTWISAPVSALSRAIVAPLQWYESARATFPGCYPTHFDPMIRGKALLGIPASTPILLADSARAVADLTTECVDSQFTCVNMRQISTYCLRRHPRSRPSLSSQTQSRPPGNRRMRLIPRKRS